MCVGQGKEGEEGSCVQGKGRKERKGHVCRAREGRRGRVMCVGQGKEGEEGSCV
jgi:hypothetical protein